MHPTHREKYSDPGTPENQRQAIFETYKTKWGERKRREDAEFQKKLDRIAEAQDWLQRIEGDPSKAHLPRPADDSEEELFKWHHEMSKPVDHVPFGNPSEQWVRRDRMWRDIQATGRADPKDIAEEEAEALRYRLQVQEARERKLRELETEFVPRRPVPEKRKEDPPVVREADPKPTWLDKFWKLAESNFFMGGGVAMAIAGYGFILAGAPRFGFWLLVIAWIVMSMSIWRHRFFEGRSKASEFMNNLITCGLVGILLFVIWILVV
jgi:hypothetical protein